MKLACAAGLLVIAAACTKSDGAPETFMKASADTVNVAPVLPSLDELVVRLDSARGFYWPRTARQLELTHAHLNEALFRAHGRPAVQRLIDCMTDTTRTATYHSDDMQYRYPRGVLCYEALRAITEVDMSRQLHIDMQHLYVIAEMGHEPARLRRAQRAWQVVHDARAYRLRTLSTD